MGVIKLGFQNFPKENPSHHWRKAWRERNRKEFCRKSFIKPTPNSETLEASDLILFNSENASSMLDKLKDLQLFLEVK